jgi:SAM-dependent methyltransferase
MKNVNCCSALKGNVPDRDYWEKQYISHTTGWDLGTVSPPIKAFIDSLTNKNLRILIPGCGNSYEAEYLLSQGFTNITVIDIAPTLINTLKAKFRGKPFINIILGDFFEHEGEYDLIIEQTFFCALPPALRQRYVWKMHRLLSDNGTIAGVLFNRYFEAGPPFGGSAVEYSNLFKEVFTFTMFSECKNSAEQRDGTEIFIEFLKNGNKVNLYKIYGLSCSGCRDTVLEKVTAINGVLNASINTDLSELLIVSSEPVPIEILSAEIGHDNKYSIEKYDLS